MGNSLVDLTGKVFGRLTVLERAPNKGRGIYWYVVCSCGANKIVKGAHLKTGGTKSCGCIHRRKDLTGETFGNLFVVEIGHTNLRGVYWKTLCSCGETFVVLGTNLYKGKVTDCGCRKNKGDQKNLLGIRFGRLIVVERSNNRNSNGKRLWKCLCDCGGKIETTGNLLKKGHTQSCGCLYKELRQYDLVGKRFGLLVVLKKSGKKDKLGHRFWECLCDCGSHTVVRGSSLTGSHTVSCGCSSREGLRKRQTKHGLSQIRIGKAAYERQRREREKNLDSRWTPLMEFCLRDYQPACVVCEAKENLVVDHVLPLSKGNGLYPGNAVTLCKRHNSMKHAKSLDQLPIEMATKIRDAAESFRVAWSGGF